MWLVVIFMVVGCIDFCLDLVSDRDFMGGATVFVALLAVLAIGVGATSGIRRICADGEPKPAECRCP